MRTARTLVTLFVLLLTAALPALAAPKHVTWSARLEPTNARAGESAKVTLTAEIEDPWYMYSLKPGDGPFPTQITSVEGGGLTQDGAPGHGATPEKKYDQGFKHDVEVFKHRAVFEVPVKLAEGSQSAQSAFVTIRYQICNAGQCLPPSPEKVEVKFNVAPGAARPDRLKSLVSAAPKVGVSDPKTQSGAAVTDEYSARVQKARSGGLLSFLLLAFGAGFVALLTPCVFPMIPITVSFFSKRQGSSPEARKQGIYAALAYCLGIVGTFTGLGLLTTALFGATGIQRLAGNPFVNAGLGLLFVVLAFNLMGAFEIMVPSGLANRAQAAQSKGGLLAPLLMGLTFTLTSFTCTVAFVGTLLAAAAQGDWIYPTIGMLAFSTAFASPFFLLALFPQYLARLPRSGSWLVTVKAFMGFVELAAALKFLSNVDLAYGWGILTRPVFLAVWATICVLAGLYMLGAIRLPHDDGVKFGAVRRVVGALTLVFAFWCLAAIEGASLGQLNGFLPPKVYPGREKLAGGEAALLTNYDEAVALAKAQNKPLFIDFTGVYCTNCRTMEDNVFPRPEVKSEFEKYVTVKLYTDRGTPADEQNKALQQKLTGVITLPTYVTLTPDGKVTKILQDLQPADVFVRGLKQGRGAE